MRQYRINYQSDNICIEYRNNEKDNWYSCAGFDEESKLVFYGNLPEEMCKEIYEFLESQCIHIDENGRAWTLIN